jgi:hypothetical protein
VTIEVEQDQTRTEGGYAVIRFLEHSADPGRATIRLLPADELAPGEEAGWTKHPFEAVETRLAGGVLEVVVGPDVVNSLPADLPIRIVIDDLAIDGICWWPSLSPLVSSGRGRLQQVERAEVTALPVAGRPKQPKAAAEKPAARTAPRLPTSPPPAPPEEPEEPEEPGGAAALPSRPAPDDPVADTRQRESRLAASIFLSFLAGLLLGGIAAAGWFLSAASPQQAIESSQVAPEAAQPDRVLLEAIDTEDFDENGNSIFATSAREWLRLGDKERTAGNAAAAMLHYRRALRAAWHEDGRELGDLVSRLAMVLSSAGAEDPEYVRTIRTLMALSAASGDPAGLCRLAILYENGIGGAVDAELAVTFRQRAARTSSGGTPAGCQ